MGDKIKQRIKVNIGSSGMILALDMGVSVISSMVALMLLRLIREPFSGFQRYIYVWTGIKAACSLVSFLIYGTYRIVIRYSNFRSVGRLAFSALTSEAIMGGIIATGLIKSGSVETELFTLIFDFLVTLTLLLVTRVIILKIIDTVSGNVDEKLSCINVAIYGISNKSVAALARLNRSAHYNVVGFITADKGRDGQVLMNKRAYCVRNAEDLARTQGLLGIEGIIFTTDEDYENEKDGIIPCCQELGITLFNVPKIDIDEETASISSTGARKAIISQEYICDGMSSFERNVKRLFDMCIAACCLVVFSPLFLIIYIAIKCEDGGPAIFKQERIGRFGRPFKIYKFRSMRTDAEAFGPALFSGDNDPRLTKVGKYIREHHLDELPQLYNVLCGDMAFIGPRPERKYYIDQIMEVDPRYYYLYQIRPGVTSYATLYNGYTDTIEKMVKRLDYDIYYLRNRSWWFDIKILWRTFRSIVFGKKF